MVGNEARIIANTISVAAIGGVVWMFGNYTPGDESNVAGAVLIAVLLVVATLAIRQWILDASMRREVNARGFEVKSTGETPVIRKIDEHGSHHPC